MTKPKVPKEPKDDAAAGGETVSKRKGSDVGADGKKKAPAKPRKRKISDAGVTTKSGAAPSKKVATEDSKADKGAEKAGAGSGAATVDPQVAAAAAIKPFVKGELTDSIKHMMFGFGDEAEPMGETAELMEDLVVEYVGSVTKKAMELAQIKGKLDPECFTFLISKDAELYERINELLRANDEFRAVLNSGFDPSDEKMY